MRLDAWLVGALSAIAASCGLEARDFGTPSGSDGGSEVGEAGGSGSPEDGSDGFSGSSAKDDGQTPVQDGALDGDAASPSDAGAKDADADAVAPDADSAAHDDTGTPPADAADVSHEANAPDGPLEAGDAPPTDASDAPPLFCVPNHSDCTGVTLSVCDAAGKTQFQQDCVDATRCDVSVPACEYPEGDYVAYATGVTGWSNGFLGLQSFVLKAPITVTKLAVIAGSAANGNLRMALYSDNGSGVPNALLAEAPSTSAALDGPLEIPVIAPLTIAAGTYWIGTLFESPSGAVHYGSDPGGYYYSSMAYGDPMPATFVSGGNDVFTRMNYYLVGYDYRWSHDGAWSCVNPENCEDVYDIRVPSAAQATIAVSNVTGTSVLRLAAFEPGVPLTGPNLMNGTLADRMCAGQDTGDSVGPTQLSATGLYRIAIGRDWGSSGGGSGTYTFGVTSNHVFFPRGQSVDDVNSLLTTTSCP